MKRFNGMLTAMVMVLALALPLAACGDDDGGPIDGTWSVTSLSCDSVDSTMVPPSTFYVNNTSGSFVLNFGADCVATIDETYAYSGDTMTITPTAVNCDPGTGCAAAIGGACIPLPPPTTFSYAVNGNTLTFSKTSEGPQDTCPAGTAVLYTMQKQ